MAKVKFSSLRLVIMGGYVGAIILLGMLGVSGWWQANSLRDELAVRDATIANLIEKPPIETIIYRYPNTPPYQVFPDPIDFDQALVLLYGMRASHEQLLHWTFEGDPGFGIADKELQKKMIKWYDQLIDFIWRSNSE